MNFYTSGFVVIATQLYWLSLLLCGYVAIHAFYGLRKKQLPEFWIKSPFFAKIVLVFAAICVIYCGWSLVGYIFRLPNWWLGVSYVVTTVLSVAYASTYLRQKVRTDLKAFWQMLKNLRLFTLFSLAILVLSAGFMLDLCFGGYLNGDALVHMAKARELAQSGFTLADPAFGDVLQSSYIVTFWHTLLAVPVFFGVNIVNSEFFSLAAAKLVILSSFFLLARYTLLAMGVKEKMTRQLSLVILVIVAVMPYAFNYSVANYPNKIVFAWGALLITGLLLVFSERQNKESPFLLILPCLLITMTHTLYSFFTGLLLALIGIGLILFGRNYLTKKIIFALAICGFILAFSPAVEYLVLHFAGTARSMEIPNTYTYWHLFGHEAFSPLYMWGLYAAEVSTDKLNGLNMLVGGMGLVGYVYILRKLKTRAGRIIFGALLLLVPLFTYVPFFFGAIHKLLPYWGIFRLFEFNILAYLSVAFGLVGLVLYASKKIITLKPYVAHMLIGFWILLVIVFRPFGLMSHDRLPADRKTFDSLHSYNQYKSLLDTQALVALAPKDSLILVTTSPDWWSLVPSAVAQVRLVATPPGNTNALVNNIQQREDCRAEIIDKLGDPISGIALMKQIKSKYILLKSNTKLEDDMLRNPSYFQLVKKNDEGSLYMLKDNTIKPADDEVCDIY